MVHRLNIDPKFKDVKQKHCAFNAKHYMIINAEVDKFPRAEFIRESQYLEWIANVVLVKKANGS